MFGKIRREINFLMNKIKKALIGGLIIASIAPTAYAANPNRTDAIKTGLQSMTDARLGELINYINKMLGCNNCITIKGLSGQVTPTQKPAATAKPAAVPTRRPVATPRPTAAPTQKPAATARPTAAPTQRPASTGTASAIEKQVLDLVNAERAKYGLSALTWADDLASIARAHSQDMIRRSFFDHTNPDGKSPFDRLKSAGIRYRYAAENIAYGQKTPEAVMNAWMNSAGHRKNILNANLKEIGVGAAASSGGTIYWTQLFVAR